MIRESIESVNYLHLKTVVHLLRSIGRLFCTNSTNFDGLAQICLSLYAINADEKSSLGHMSTYEKTRF